MGILEKISEIEKEIARTQKNKGHHCIDIVTYLNLYIYVLYLLFLLLDIVSLIYHLREKKKQNIS